MYIRISISCFCPFGISSVALRSALCRFQSISTGVLVFLGRFHFFFQKGRVLCHNTPSCQVWARLTVSFRRSERFHRIIDFQTFRLTKLVKLVDRYGQKVEISIYKKISKKYVPANKLTSFMNPYVLVFFISEHCLPPPPCSGVARGGTWGNVPHPP